MIFTECTENNEIIFNEFFKRNNKSNFKSEKEDLKLKKINAIKKIIPDLNTGDNRTKGTYNDYYYINNNIPIQSITASSITDIIYGYSSIDSIKEFKDKKYPALWIESLALMSKSEFDKHVKSSTYHTGDYYQFPDNSKLDSKKHFTTIIDANICMVNYCSEDKICYIINPDPDGNKLILGKISLDELYNCAKKCLDDYNKLVRTKSLNESYIEGAENKEQYEIIQEFGDPYKKIIKQYKNDFTTNHYDLNKYINKLKPKLINYIDSKFKSFDGYKIYEGHSNEDRTIEVYLQVNYNNSSKFANELKKLSIGTNNININEFITISTWNNNIIMLNNGLNYIDDNAAESIGTQIDITFIFTEEDLKMSEITVNDIMTVLKSIKIESYNLPYSTLGFVKIPMSKSEYKNIEEKIKPPHTYSGNAMFIFNNKNINESNILTFSGNNGGSYIHDALYESYIQSKIDSEERLAFALKESMVISEADYSNIRAIQEAKLSDKIKSKWKKFIAFIKGMVARFMESMSNILLDEKDYLEKYKDIILNKKPKEDMEYSYTGNYRVGIDRLISTEVPMFDYYKYKNQLEAEGNSDLVEAIMQGKNFHYDDGETLAEQFKGYFLAFDDGQQQGKFSDLNMTDIYNFCYNFSKIKGIVDKDIKRLEESTRAIESAINKELNATGNDAAGDKVEKTETNTAANANATTTNNESTIIKEAEEENKNTNLKIDKPSSDPTSKMGSTQNRDSQAEKDAATAGSAVAKNDGKEANDITKAANKWIDVCRPLIAAKLTACQQIAKDYMDIIRAHVRSYGGTDKKAKESNKAPDQGTKYSKHPDVAKAQKDAENAKKESETT